MLGPRREQWTSPQDTWESGPRMVEDTTELGPISEHSMRREEDTLEFWTMEEFHWRKTEWAVEFWMVDCGSRMALWTEEEWMLALWDI